MSERSSQAARINNGVASGLVYSLMKERSPNSDPPNPDADPTKRDDAARIARILATNPMPMPRPQLPERTSTE